MARSRPTLLIVFSLLVIGITASACSSSRTDQVSNRYNCRFLPNTQAQVDGKTYSPLWGPMRSDILRTAAFRETDLQATDDRECPGLLPGNIHEIAGVPLDEIFVEVRHTKNTNGSNHTFSVACHFTNEAYVFTAVGAAESPPPFSRPPGEPWSEGSPTPTPRAPVDGPLVELTSEGMLEAGWPYLELFAPDGRKVYWDSGLKLLYKGREYHLSATRRDDREGRPEPIEEITDQIDIIFVEYTENRWPEGLAKSLPHLLTDGKVEDRIRLLRPLDRPSQEVIIIDPCPTFPTNLQPDNIVFWGRVFPPQPEE